MFSVALPDCFSGTYDETARLLAKLVEHGNGSWQPVYIDTSSGKKVAVLYETPYPHGLVETLDLATTVKQSDAKALAASLARRGLQLISFDPFKRQAVAGSIWPAHDAIRHAIADAINCDPWEIGITVEWKDARIESVTITGASLPVGAEQRLTLLRNVTTSCVPGGTDGWRIELDMPSKSARLVYGLPAQLPKLCQLSDLLPVTVRSDDWAELPIGVGTDGAQVAIDLKSGPHSLIVGPTGSGKSICLNALIASALARGFQLGIVEAVKSGVDFAWARPYASYWAEDLASGQQVMEQIYGEVTRRKMLIKKMEVSNWVDLDPALRRREDVAPLLVVVDEYGSLALDEPIPKGLAKDDPYLVEAVERNTQRSIIQSIVGKIAREARFVGVHLAVAIQRPDAKIISGELRSNLTSAIQLIASGKIPSSDTLGMVLPGEQAPLAAEMAALLDDGTSKGLALLAAEGGNVQGARVAFAPPRDIPDLLQSIGVGTLRLKRVG
jgi:DNA segregation ATPase FtsK/SpoIIIE-like protein